MNAANILEEVHSLVLPRQTAGARVMRFIRRKPLGAAGAVLLILLCVTALFANVIAQYGPNDTNVVNKLKPPSSTYFFGTDNLGRDVFSRVVFGARLSLAVSLTVSIAGSIIGGSIGIISAYIGGKVDSAIQRPFDVLQAFPLLILLLALVSALGSSLTTVLVALTIGVCPGQNRIVRSAALAAKAAPYVEAAHSLGASHLRIMVRYIAPNCLAPWMVVAASLFGGVIVAEASLAFLGLGIPPPFASWGRDLAAAQPRVSQAPWLAIFPGIAMSLVVFGANLFGDAMRDVLDPRLRGR